MHRQGQLREDVLGVHVSKNIYLDYVKKPHFLKILANPCSIPSTHISTPLRQKGKINPILSYILPVIYLHIFNMACLYSHSYFFIFPFRYVYWSAHKDEILAFLSFLHFSVTQNTYITLFQSVFIKQYRVQWLSFTFSCFFS